MAFWIRTIMSETGESPTSSDAIKTLGIINLLLSYVFWGSK